MASDTVLITSVDSAQKSVHPSISPVSVSTIAFNRPSVCSKVRVRGNAAAGIRAMLIFLPERCASSSPIPMRDSGGSINTE